jgi:DNA excision repair protein ERCC-4
MNTLKITIDYREIASGLSDLLKDSGALVEIEKLSYGDYIINDMITIERKTAKDFLVSIIDGRLFNQLSNLKKFCNHPILLIEGNPYKTVHNFDRMAIKGTLISTQTIWYVPVIFSRTKEDSLYILQGFPKVGPKLAKRLLRHFKSVSKVMNASVRALTEVDGIGKISAERIREILDAEVY